MRPQPPNARGDRGLVCFASWSYLNRRYVKCTVKAAIEFVVLPNGNLERLRQLIDIGRIDYEIDVVQEGSVQVSRADACHQINKEETSSFRRSQQPDLARHECHTLLERIEVRVENDDVHALFAHAPQCLRHV